MCKWCEQYGEGGKWYLNPANYARRLYKLRTEEAVSATSPPQAAIGMGGPFVEKIVETKYKDPDEYTKYKAEAEQLSHLAHFAQVVTLEETLQICDIAYPIAKMTCACRRAFRGLANQENFFCIGTGPGMYKWERWPETYRGGVQFMTPEEAKEMVIQLDRLGMVHTIDTFGTPYIGGLCQCDYPSCVFIRLRLDYGICNLIKGEYISRIDPEKCNGCALCIKRCQFSALKMDVTAAKARIDMFQCFGCGLCLTACTREAIELIDRGEIPALKNNW